MTQDRHDGEGRALAGRVAVVTGATRGCGRGIAVELGARGATVYAAGRTTRDTASPLNRPETIEETAELVTAAGGRGVPVRCDLTEPADVDALRDRLESDVDGRLDILVNDVWGGDHLHDFDSPYWAQPWPNVHTMVRNGVDSHLLALHRLLPLLTARPGGLVVEVTDGDDETYHGAGLAYFLVKASVRAIGRALAGELAAFGCTGLAVTPGFIRSEAMLEHFGVTERTWQEARSEDGHAVHFARMSESPHYLGRAVAALAADQDVSRFAGRTLGSWTLKREYGFTDTDGSQPDWGAWMDEVLSTGSDPSTVEMSRYR